MKAVIIGAGLGGLECGRLLAQHGLEVIVLEQQPKAGGCLQTFERNGVCFDTGLHCVGGLDEGERLGLLFEQLGLKQLPWKAMNRDLSNQIVIDGRDYTFPMGHDAYADRLKQYFPHQKPQIDHYVSLLKLVGDGIGRDVETREQMLALSAYDSLCQIFDDPLLIQVVSGASMMMDLAPERLPLYSFLQINDSFLRGAYRLEGGGDSIVRQLSDDIERMGGRVVTSARVDKISVENGKVISLEATLKGGECLHIDEPDWVISDINPTTTFEMTEGANLRSIYRHRIAQMPNSRGSFTANLILKKGTLPYQNHNVFIHKDCDIWHHEAKQVEDVMIHYAVTRDDEPTCIDLMAPMDWSVVQPWSNPDHPRDEAYRSLKQRWLDEAVEMASTALPKLKESIDKAYTSTPLTYYRYNGVVEGAAFGVERDWHKGTNSVISPRTPISNLLLTGQNLMLHGVLGVTMTAFDTVSHILNTRL